MSPTKDTEPAAAPEPMAAPEPAPAGRITVVSSVKIGDVEVGVPTEVADNAEWRALIHNGMASLVG